MIGIKSYRKVMRVRLVERHSLTTAHMFVVDSFEVGDLTALF